MSQEKVFCGSGKIIKTKHGDLTKISFSEADLQKMLDNLSNGWINTVLKEKKVKVDGKPTHYLEVDFWKPDAVSAQNVNKKEAEITEGDDLPF